MALPVIVSIVYQQPDTTQLIISFFITFVSGTILYLFTRKHKGQEIRRREAFIIVTFTWISTSFFGSILYMLTGTFHSFTDAFFESMAGFTTTGASVLTNIEATPKGVLFWRNMTQWIGGMGIIVFALAILPLLRTGVMQLFKAEVPEISVDKLRPRIIDTAKALWLIYLSLTALNTALLQIAGVDFYDAVCHAFTTIATGGFSTKDNSIAHFQSPSIEYITSIFIFISGISYTLHFYVFKGKVSRLWRSNEFRFYLTVVVIAVILITFNLWKSTYTTLAESFRYSIFQVVAITTGTGYHTADYEKWSFFAQLLLVFLMFFGGMIGSTTGGIKQVRILLMLKQGYREIFQMIHPHAVTTLKLDKKFLSKEILGSVWGFVFIFLAICAVATLGMAALGTDIVTSLTTVISATCNVGPALGEAGPTDGYASIPEAGKWILIFCMLTGRLEVFTVLILLVPHFWKR